MRCCECKYYEESREHNRCDKTGYEYFITFYEKECPFVDNDYNETDTFIRLLIEEKL